MSDRRVCIISVSPSSTSLAIYAERVTLGELLSHPLPQFPICKMGSMLIANVPIYLTVLFQWSHELMDKKGLENLKHCEHTALTLTLNVEVITASLLSNLDGIRWYMQLSQSSAFSTFLFTRAHL